MGRQSDATTGLSEDGSTEHSPQASAEGRIERRRRATHDRLLDATRELLLAHGPRCYTVADLAEVADLGIGTVYNHFDAWSDAPLAEIAQLVLAAWRLRVADELERQPNAAVAAAHLIHLLSQAPEGSWTDPRLVDLLVCTDQWPRDDALQVTEILVEAGLADGSMASDVDSSLVASSLLGLALQVIALTVADDRPTSDQLNAMVSRILAATVTDLEPVIDLR